MADNPADAPNRATVALVSEQLKGLSELTKAGFVDVQRQLGRVDGLPERVTALEAKREALEQRVSDLEAGRHGDKRFVRENLPIIVLTVLVAAAAIGTLITQLHH